MTYKEAYDKVYDAVSEAASEYLGREEGNEELLDGWDKGLDVVEEATKIAEALKALIADMEAKDTWSVHISKLKEILEGAKC